MTRRAVLAAFVTQPDELADKWNAFATVSKEWAEKMNNGIKDVKLQRKMSKLFHQLEETEGWPK